MQLPKANVRAASYFIVRTWTACPQCRAATLVTALAVGPGHEICEDEPDDWQPVQANAFLFQLAAIAPAVALRLESDAANLRFEFLESTGEACWTNHCQHCGLPIGDEELHDEPGIHGFVLCSEAHAEGIVLSEIAEPFEALAGGYALEPEFFAYVQRT